MGIFLPGSRQSLYLRITIPLALRVYFNGRREVWRSLKTSNREAASVLAAQIESQAKRVFWTLRRSGHLMDQDTIERIVSQWLATTLERVDEDRLLGGSLSDEAYDQKVDDLHDYQGLLLEHLRGNEFNKVTVEADRLLQDAGLPRLDHSSREFKRLCKRLLEAHVEYTQQHLLRLNGAYRSFHRERPSGSSGESPRLGSEGLPPSDLGRSPHSPPQTKLFSEIVDLYYQENKPRSERSNRQIRSELNRFLVTIGGDKPIGAISKEQCRFYKEDMMQVRRLSLVTVRKWLGAVSSIFRWAGRQGFTPDNFKNPVEGLSPDKKRARELAKSHRDYTDQELLAVFGSNHFIKQRNKRPDRYWMVLICLFTMCRREEAGQLLLHDIKEQEGIHFFNFTDEGEEQQLKTNESRRKVPIHSSLIELGFLDYVQALRAKGETRLFPNIKKGKNTFADAAGKWYARHLKKVGLTDKSLVLHGLRHTGITRLANAGANDKVRRVLVGHAGQDVHDRIYNHGTPLPMLKEGLEKLQYPEVLHALKNKTQTDKAA